MYPKLCFLLLFQPSLLAYTVRNIHGGDSIATKIMYDLQAGEKCCFYEVITEGYDLFITGELLEEVSYDIDITVRSPNGNKIEEESISKDEIEFKISPTQQGAYEVCLQNFNTFGQARLSLSMFAWEVSSFQKKMENFAELEVVHGNIVERVTNVSQHIMMSSMLLSHSNKHDIRDYNLMKKKEQYVDRSSIFNCSLILASGLLQLYFIRKLFMSVN